MEPALDMGEALDGDLDIRRESGLRLFPKLRDLDRPYAASGDANSSPKRDPLCPDCGESKRTLWKLCRGVEGLGAPLMGAR